MSKKFEKKAVVTAAIGLASAIAFGAANAAQNPFAMQDLGNGYTVADSHKGKDGKCGGDKKKAKDAKCGGDMKKGKDAKCGNEKKMKDGKCGEGKCGGKK